jgi:demethylspheroidene O-methyltransferase
MAQSQTLVAEEALRVVDLRGVTDASRYRRRHGRLPDGCGPDAHPDLHLHLFDLPVVAEGAAARFQRNGLTGRSTITGGNFRTDAIPEAPTRSASCAFSTTIPTTRCACFWPRRMPRWPMADA